MKRSRAKRQRRVHKERAAQPPLDERKEAYSQDLAAGCIHCDSSLGAEFRLAPKQQIFDVLGYV